MLSSYYTTPRTSINETSFNLVFGMEAVIPVEIGLPTMQIEHYDESSNPVQLRANLNLLEETRDNMPLHGRVPIVGRPVLQFLDKFESLPSRRFRFTLN